MPQPSKPLRPLSPHEAHAPETTPTRTAPTRRGSFPTAGATPNAPRHRLHPNSPAALPYPQACLWRSPSARRASAPLRRPFGGNASGQSPFAGATSRSALGGLPPPTSPTRGLPPPKGVSLAAGGFGGSLCAAKSRALFQAVKCCADKAASVVIAVARSVQLWAFPLCFCHRLPPPSARPLFTLQTSAEIQTAGVQPCGCRSIALSSRPLPSLPCNPS